MLADSHSCVKKKLQFRTCYGLYRTDGILLEYRLAGILCITDRSCTSATAAAAGLPVLVAPACSAWYTDTGGSQLAVPAQHRTP
eukprot:7289-Heterococcus_DN1.PRE.1